MLLSYLFILVFGYTHLFIYSIILFDFKYLLLYLHPANKYIDNNYCETLKFMVHKDFIIIARGVTLGI